MNNYINQSEKERILLKEVINHTKLNPLYYGYDKKIWYTPEDGMDVYDAVVNRFIQNSPACYDTHIFEAKIRDKDYPTILLEKDKLNNLKLAAKKWNNTGIPTTIFYLSCHPSGTYLFNLTKLEKDIKWIKEEHNISSTEMHKGKKTKIITYLPIEKALKIDLTSYYISNLHDKSKKDIIHTKENIDAQMTQKRVVCLFKILMG